MNLQSERPPNAAVYVPGELIFHVLSFLPVKSVIRLRCASKTLNSLISDSTFVKLHLNQSARNIKLVYTTPCNTVVSFTVFRTFENPPIIFNLPKDPYYELKDKDCFYIVGSCNGLLCMYGHCFNSGYRDKWWWLRIWNPATRTISDKQCYNAIDNIVSPYHLRFGYDNSTNTYKVLYFVPNKIEARVLTWGDNNVWRNIQNSPVEHECPMKLVHMRDSVNWLTICNHYDIYDGKNITMEQYAIISLDLGTETHTKLRPPPGFSEITLFGPDLSMLKDCLCISHELEQTYFVIWGMKEFGVEESWTQFLKICYHDFLADHHFNYFPLSPPCYLEKNDDTLILKKYSGSGVIICNWRYNIIERINKVKIIDEASLLSGHNYVESLVWYC